MCKSFRSDTHTNTWWVKRMPKDAVSTRSIQIWGRCPSVCGRWAKEIAPTHHHPGLTIFCFRHLLWQCLCALLYVYDSYKHTQRTHIWFSMIFRHQWAIINNTHCAQPLYLIIWFPVVYEELNDDWHRKASATHTLSSIIWSNPWYKQHFLLLLYRRKHFTIHKPNFYYTPQYYALRSQDAAQHFFPLRQTHNISDNIIVIGTGPIPYPFIHMN